jgi:hypothetical protein
MALYIPRSIFHLAPLLFLKPETFGPYYVESSSSLWSPLALDLVLWTLAVSSSETLPGVTSLGKKLRLGGVCVMLATSDAAVAAWSKWSIVDPGVLHLSVFSGNSMWSSRGCLQRTHM